MEWSTVWSAVSALFTALTAILAAWAIVRWKKQDELKAKMAFKTAIADYSYLLTQMPVMLSIPYEGYAYTEDAKKLSESLAACYRALMLCEGLLDSNETVAVGWEFIFNNNKFYLNGSMDSTKLGAVCMGILHEKFIFK